MLLKSTSPLPIGEFEKHCLKLQKCFHSFPESELLILRFCESGLKQQRKMKGVDSKCKLAESGSWLSLHESFSPGVDFVVNT